jgi:5,6-dimethylbenzimidazole synthase
MENTSTVSFSDQERAALYKTIFYRRDVRAQFKSTPIANDVLSRILYAAHHAPSVGFMQPWNFIVVQSPVIKTRIHDTFIKANEEAAQLFSGEREPLYKSLKLEGIKEAPINICITCDRHRMGDVVLGRTHNRDMDLYSCVCAVQNLWLAARSEGVGVGWVSIFDEQHVKHILSIPDEIVPVAYLCLGYVDFFYTSPELELKRWQSRLPLHELVSFDGWQQTPNTTQQLLIDQIKQDQQFTWIDTI